MAEKVWRVREVAEHLEVTVETVLKRLHEGTLKGFRVGRAWRIRDSALEEFKQPSIEATPPDPFSDLNMIIAPGGQCTRASEKDQHHRDTQGREWTPPDIPE